MSRPKMNLRVEQLEDRAVPAAVSWGVPWPDATHLTMSFAPDGTPLGDRVSSLFQTLDAQLPRATWQREILRAYQTWAVNANINLGIIPDGGQALGADGVRQGDQRFGDIRVAAYSLAPTALALTSPFSLMAGTWSGDLKINSSFRFGSGTGAYDLFTAILQEAGHSFGIGNSPNAVSAMFESYQGPRAGLAAEDISALQTLYGVREPDDYEGDSGNNTAGLATLIRVDGGRRSSVDADLTTMSDVDYYKFRPNGVNNVTLRLRTAGYSLLAPKITVYDANQNVLATSSSTNPMGAELSIQLSGLGSGLHYVKVERATDDVFGIGSYRLTAFPTGNPPPDETVRIYHEEDQHTNDTQATATALRGKSVTADPRYDVIYYGKIEDATDVDYFKIRTPQPTAGATQTMTIMFLGTDLAGLRGKVSVVNAQGQPVASDVLRNDGATYILQVPNVASDAVYYIKGAARKNSGSANVGNYAMGIDFTSRTITRDTHGTGTLSQASSQAFHTLSSTQTRLRHFAISADNGGSAIESAVRLTIIDENGRVVATMVVEAGETATMTVLLNPGKYTIRINGATRDKSKTLAGLNYRLASKILDDPIGPGTNDSTDSASDTWGGGSGSPPPSGNLPPPSDPYDDPWWA